MRSAVKEDLDLSGITKFLNANPCYRLEARFSGRDFHGKRDGTSFLVGIYQLHSGLYRPGFDAKTLYSGLYVISKTVEDFDWADFRDAGPVIKCAECSPDEIPLHEVLPNLAETLRKSNRSLLLQAKRDGQKIVTALATYYNPNEVNAGCGARKIIYFEDDSFRPDYLEALRFPEHNVETFFAGIDAEVMLRIREKRLEKEE